MYVLIFLSTLTENFQNRFATVTGLLLLVEILGITNSFSEQYKNERILIPKKERKFSLLQNSPFSILFFFSFHFVTSNYFGITILFIPPNFTSIHFFSLFLANYSIFVSGFSVRFVLNKYQINSHFPFTSH